MYRSSVYEESLCSIPKHFHCLINKLFKPKLLSLIVALIGDVTDGDYVLKIGQSVFGIL